MESQRDPSADEGLGAPVGPTEQDVREAALRERAGPSPEARERLRAECEAATDWVGRCRRCGATFTGTLAQARAGCPSCGATT